MWYMIPIEMCSINSCCHAKSLLVCQIQNGRDGRNVFFCCLSMPSPPLYFQVRDVVQYINVIICLKSLVFKWSKELQSIHCIQNSDLTFSIKRKLFALWNFAWIFNSFSLFEYSSKKLLYLKLLIRFQSVTVTSCHIMSHKYWWFISTSFWPL